MGVRKVPYQKGQTFIAANICPRPLPQVTYPLHMHACGHYQICTELEQADTKGDGVYLGLENILRNSTVANLQLIKTKHACDFIETEGILPTVKAR